MVKLLAIIYNNYKSRQISTPYFNTLLTVLLIIIFHTVHLGILLKIPSKYIMPWSPTDPKLTQWLYASIYFATLITIIATVLKKSKLEKITVTEKEIKKSKVILPLYLFMCVVLLGVLLVKVGIEKGKIG